MGNLQKAMRFIDNDVLIKCLVYYFILFDISVPEVIPCGYV